MTGLVLACEISAIIANAICLTIFGVEHAHMSDGFILSTAYWMTVTSGLCSLLAVGTLTLDAIQLRHDPLHYLTPKQRNLSLMSFVFMAYIIVGSLMFKFVLERRFVPAYFVTS